MKPHKGVLIWDNQASKACELAYAFQATHLNPCHLASWKCHLHLHEIDLAVDLCYCSDTLNYACEQICYMQAPAILTTWPKVLVMLNWLATGQGRMLHHHLEWLLFISGNLKSNNVKGRSPCARGAREP